MSMSMSLYIELDLLCIAILMIIFYRDARQRNNDECHRLFARVMISNILFFSTDIAWGVLSCLSAPLVGLNWAVNICYYILSAMTGYFWLDYVKNMLNEDYSPKPVVRIVKALPVLVLGILAVASVKTHWLFYIDESGVYNRGYLHFLQPVLAYILPMYATVRAVVKMKKCAIFELKRQYRSLALYYVMPFFGGVLQAIFYGTPMLNIGITLSGLWLYFSLQDIIIMLDPLTSMNNRRCFDRSLKALIRDYDEKSGKKLRLMLMDLDYFKSINDGFGHAEGDRALIAVAGVLKDVCGRYRCTVARVGGDEFAVCFESSDDGIIEKLCNSINGGLDKISSQFRFRLHFSIGVSEYRSGMTAEQLTVAADSMLYEIKSVRSLENK